MKRTIIKFIFGPATGETMIKTVQNHAARAKNVFLVFTLLIASLGIITFSGYAADVSMKTLPGHVPSVVSNLKSESALSSDTNLNLAIGLPLRNQQELNSLLQQVYDPASTNYHHYLTPEQFTAEFGPTEQDYQSIKDFAKANGFKVTKEYGNRMLLDVQGRVGDIEKAFNITLRLYHHPTENRDFFAPDSEPTKRHRGRVLARGLLGFSVRVGVSPADRSLPQRFDLRKELVASLLAQHHAQQRAERAHVAAQRSLLQVAGLRLKLG